MERPRLTGIATLGRIQSWPGPKKEGDVAVFAAVRIKPGLLYTVEGLEGFDAFDGPMQWTHPRRILSLLMYVASAKSMC